jgi:hypothetical protein
MDDACEKNQGKRLLVLEEVVMTAQAVLNSLNDLPLMELYKVASETQRAIEKQKRLLISSVSAERNERTVYLKHPTNGTYVCKQVAYRGRWRMWKMVPGQRGLKQGPMVVHEAMGDLDDLRIQVALGYYKDSI